MQDFGFIRAQGSGKLREFAGPTGARHFVVYCRPCGIPIYSPRLAFSSPVYARQAGMVLGTTSRGLGFCRFSEFRLSGLRVMLGILFQASRWLWVSRVSSTGLDSRATTCKTEIKHSKVKNPQQPLSAS